MKDVLTPWDRCNGTMGVRDLLNMDLQQVWNLPEGRWNMSFDDGKVIKSSYRRMILDRTLLELFKDYPEVPIYHDCSTSFIIGEGVVNDSTHTRVLNAGFKRIIEHYNITSYDDKEPILRKVVDVRTNLFNDITLNLGNHITTIDATDFVSFYKIPEVKEILSRVENHPDSIDQSHKDMNKWLMTTDNQHPLVLPNKAGSVRITQFNQCVGPRGFITDLDRTVFGTAIETGFIRGLRKAYDFAIEARTPAKALNASERHIRDSEYTSRRFRLVGMVVGEPVFGDCGSNDFSKIVMTQRYLTNTVGKYYKTDDDPTLRVIKGDEEHLIGEYVYLRHVKGCTLSNRKQVCTTCLGDLANNLRPDTNLGAEVMLFFMVGISQGILSFKHETKSVSGAAIRLDELCASYFVPGENNSLWFNTIHPLEKLSLVIPKSGMNKLMDVLTISEVDINMSNVGEMTQVGMLLQDRKVNDVLVISNDDRKAIMTVELLNYMRDNEDIYTLNPKGDYVVDLSKWNINDPVLHIPLKEEDILAFLKKVIPMVEGTSRKRFTYEEHLITFIDLVLSKTDCNFTIMEVMAYAISTYNPENMDYRLSRNSPNPQITSKNDLFAFRSMGQLLPYEKQMSFLTRDPHKLYDNTKIEWHPLDIQFAPQDVMLDRIRKNKGIYENDK